MTPCSLVGRYKVATLKTTGWNFRIEDTWFTLYLRVLETFGHPCLAPLLSKRKLKVGLDRVGGGGLFYSGDGGECAPLVRGWRVFLKASLWRIYTLRLVTINQKKIFWNKGIYKSLWKKSNELPAMQLEGLWRTYWHSPTNRNVTKRGVTLHYYGFCVVTWWTLVDRSFVLS